MSSHPELDTQAEGDRPEPSSKPKDDGFVSDRAALLRKAEQIIAGHRDDAYGTPEDSFNAIAAHWTEYIRRSKNLINGGLTAGDVAAMMVLLKVARMETGGLAQTDSWLDIAGYAACGFETQHLDRP